METVVAFFVGAFVGAGVGVFVMTLVTAGKNRRT